MRKLKLQVQISADGLIGGPLGEMDWFTWNWGDDIKSYVQALHAPVDTIVLGRKLAEGFIPYWAEIASTKDHPEHEFAHIMTDTHKIVFSKTLDANPWQHNTVIAKGNLVDEINKLKSQPGGDIIAYGGANFDSSLIRENLIDEYHLFVNPVVAGKGLPIFADLPAVRRLKLVKASPFECGITVMHYEPMKIYEEVRT